MRRLAVLLPIVCLGMAGCGLSSTQTITLPPPETKAVVEGNTEFAVDLYKQLAEKNEGNLFCSPLSVSTALSMTYAGARGTTAEEMANTLHFPRDGSLHPAMAHIQKELTASKQDGVEVRMANSLFGQDGYPWKPEFLRLTHDQYGAGLETVDFAEKPDDARRFINLWVEDHTEDKIKDLFPPDVIDADTRLVLANAIYFKGKWAHEFKPSSTREAPFFIGEGQSTKVPMMFQEGKFRFQESADAMALDLPYQGDRLSMLLLLPKENDGLAEIEKRLSVEKLNMWTNKLAETKVQVWLPKFKFTRAFRLDETLKDLGMPTAFTRRADFSGLNGGPEQLRIAAVMHKAFVEVNEEGTEAAAATGVSIGAKSESILPQFRADHPFLFLIRSNTDGSILFMGRVSDPSKIE